MRQTAGVNRAGSEHAYVALGSNLGDPIGTILEASHSLQLLSQEPILSSSLWETTPVDCPKGAAPFINAVVRMLPPKDETPETLLGKLQELERRFGRLPKRVHNESRPLDLDLILFGSEARHSVQLILPHPRALSRRFVLEPLNEIAPGLVFPGQSKTVAELLNALPLDLDMRPVRRI